MKFLKDLIKSQIHTYGVQSFDEVSTKTTDLAAADSPFKNALNLLKFTRKQVEGVQATMDVVENIADLFMLNGVDEAARLASADVLASRVAVSYSLTNWVEDDLTVPGDAWRELFSLVENDLAEDLSYVFPSYNIGNYMGKPITLTVSYSGDDSYPPVGLTFTLAFDAKTFSVTFGNYAEVVAVSGTYEGDELEEVDALLDELTYASENMENIWMQLRQAPSNGSVKTEWFQKFIDGLPDCEVKQDALRFLEGSSFSTLTLSSVTSMCASLLDRFSGKQDADDPNAIDPLTVPSYASSILTAVVQLVGAILTTVLTAIFNAIGAVIGALLSTVANAIASIAEKWSLTRISIPATCNIPVSNWPITTFPNLANNNDGHKLTYPPSVQERVDANGWALAWAGTSGCSMMLCTPYWCQSVATLIPCAIEWNLDPAAWSHEEVWSSEDDRFYTVVRCQTDATTWHQNASQWNDSYFNDPSEPWRTMEDNQIADFMVQRVLNTILYSHWKATTVGKKVIPSVVNESVTDLGGGDYYHFWYEIQRIIDKKANDTDTFLKLSTCMSFIKAITDYYGTESYWKGAEIYQTEGIAQPSSACPVYDEEVSWPFDEGCIDLPELSAGDLIASVVIVAAAAITAVVVAKSVKRSTQARVTDRCKKRQAALASAEQAVKDDPSWKNKKAFATANRRYGRSLNRANKLGISQIQGVRTGGATVVTESGLSSLASLGSGVQLDQVLMAINGGSVPSVKEEA